LTFDELTLKPQTISYAEDWMPIPQRLLIKTMEAVTGRGRLMRRYRAFQSASTTYQTPDVWDVAMDHLGCRGPATEHIKIPERRKNRGLLLVANHPFGVSDGVTLAWIASRLDPNFRVIANGVLRQEPTLNPNILPIEFQPGRQATKLNVDTRRQSIQTLKNGGVVALFPAGGVSWSQKRGAPVEDDPWKPLVGRLVKASECDVLPVRFDGSNSKLFQQASRTALTLRLGLYMHEIKKRLDQPIHFELMPIIENEHIPDIPEQALAHWLRNQLFSGNGINSFSPGT
jgi:putative hemolysin